MPWCETCSRFLNPNTLEPDGSCPTCGRVIAAPADRPAAVPGADGQGEVRAPWHFKLLLVALVVYLGWRLVQMVGWIVT